MEKERGRERWIERKREGREMVERMWNHLLKERGGGIDRSTFVKSTFGRVGGGERLPRFTPGRMLTFIEGPLG